MTLGRESIQNLQWSKADPERWMKWLLSFCQRDLKRLRNADWASLLEDLAALCGSSSAVNFPRMWGDESLVNAFPRAHDEFTKGKMMGLRTRNDILRTQKSLKEGLAQLYPQPIPIDHEEAFRIWKVPASIDTVCITRLSLVTGQRFAKKGRSKESKMKSVFLPRVRWLCQWPDLFWLAVAEIIEACGPNLRQCVECKTLFLRQKKQTFCSEACSQKVRSRRWYKLHHQQIKKERRQEKVRKIFATTEAS